jgi:hypothetical protein
MRCTHVVALLEVAYAADQHSHYSRTVCRAGPLRVSVRAFRALCGMLRGVYLIVLCLVGLVDPLKNPITWTPARAD